MTNLFDPPPVFALPVSLGGDIIVDFKNRVPDSDPAEYEDYPDDWSVKLVIGKGDTVIEAPAEISTHHAVCRIESEQADAIKDKTQWRVVISIAGSPESDDIVAMNGKVARADG